MTRDALAALLREHTRLQGALAANIETWLNEPGTLERYLALVPRPRTGETRLVDIGCYQPSVAYYFSLGWRDVIGTFVDEGEGTAATTERGEGGAVATFVRGDAEIEPLPIPDGWADAVLMMQVWEHFGRDPMRVLWEMNRVLKPGGRLVLSTPNGASAHYAMRIARGRAAWGGMEFTGFSYNRHNRLYDVEEMRVIAALAGFTVHRCETRDFDDPQHHWSERAFRIGLAVVDGVARLVSGRRRERGQTLILEASKSGSPVERFPSSLYLTEADWPGLAEQRDRVLANEKVNTR